MELGKNLFVTAETWKIFSTPGLGESFQWKQGFSAKNADLAMVIVSQMYVTFAKLFYY